MRKSVKASAVFSDLLPCDPPCPAARGTGGRAGTFTRSILSRVPMFELCMMAVFLVMARI